MTAEPRKPAACAVCGKGPHDGVNIFRMNATGQPGLWACNEHKDHFDGRIDPEVKEIVDLLGGADR